jgi:glycosyltransferase involved in cell wall biosynthesis
MRAPSIKVLLVGPLPPPFGGIPSYVQKLYDSQVDGVRYQIFNTAFPSWIAALNREGKMSYSSIRENGIWGAIKKVVFVMISYPVLAYKILTTKPDIVQVFTCSYWGYWRNWLYVLIAKLCGKKTIFHILNAIDVFYGSASDIEKIWIRKSFESADLNLVQSPGLKKWLDQYCHGTVLGLWNGIDLDGIPGKKNDRMILGEKIPTGITVGGLGRNKGTFDIITALRDLREDGLNLKWIFVGGGNINAFQELAKSFGVADIISFTGPIEEARKWEYIQDSDFYCLPSYAEGQPISIIEAMATGLPVISTNVGSIPEIVQDKISGIIIQPGNHKALEDAIKTMVLNENERKRMGENALKSTLERHNINFLFAQLIGAYRSLT